MTCIAREGVILCTGRGATTKRRSPCPHCCIVGPDSCFLKPWPIMLVTEIHSGYCAPDYICGRCGHQGNYEDDRYRRVGHARREENKKRVRAFGRKPRLPSDRYASSFEGQPGEKKVTR